jgi:uncharacterized DUF497 family protein
MDIEFDPVKNKANIRKHGISFADIEEVFYDQCAITIEGYERNLRFQQG